MNKLTAVQNHFNRYLQVGGFPELALADDDTFAQQIMREDVVDKVLKRDLPALYNIRNATELERIFLYLCNVSSGIVAAFYYQKATREGYYRGGGKNKEIDIVEHCDKALAAIIITKRADDFGEHTSGNGKKLLRIPAFAFLYLLGHAEKHGYKGIK